MDSMENAVNIGLKFQKLLVESEKRNKELQAKVDIKEASLKLLIDRMNGGCCVRSIDKGTAKITNEGVKGLYFNFKPDCVHLQAKVERLEKYASHDDLCEMNRADYNEPKCTCGLDELLAEDK